MYVLIGGAGMVGLGLAQQLLDLGHTVAIVDVDPLACRFAREKIGVMAFEGSAVSTKVLLEAGIRQAKAVVAALRDDAMNLACIIHEPKNKEPEKLDVNPVFLGFK